MGAVQFSGVSANFGESFSVEGIDWSIESSQHWVLLGPNGAGKSALAALLVGDGEQTAGTLSGVPERVAIVSFEAQQAMIEAELKKDDADILDVIAEGTPVAEVLAGDCQNPELRARLITLLQMDALQSRALRKLSTGESRKVLIIKALCSNPSIVVLDEPFEGLDQQSCEVLKSLLAELSSQMQCVFVLSRFDEIPDFVTHMGYMSAGRLNHRVDRADASRCAEIEQLLHLEVSDISLPDIVADDALPPLNPSDPLVRMRDLKVAYGDNTVFDGVDWEILPGQHWQLTGPNGSGKTCMLKLITGDHPQCYVNDIFVFGMQRGSGESIWQIKQYIGYVSSALLWDYRVSANVQQVIVSGFFDSIGVYQKASDAQLAVVAQWLELLGMTARKGESFNQLSFGDKRLVLIARAMVKSPPLLILDEPCLGLDDINRQLVLALIEKICAGDRTTVLYVNHKAEDTIAGIEHHMTLG